MSFGTPSSKAMVLLDLKQNPLGLGKGDPSFQAPFNASLPQARVYLINHSAAVRRKFVKVGVSFKRGAAQALQADAELRKLYNIATLREAVADGQDMNVYAEKISPVLYGPRWNNTVYRIPPAMNPGDPPPRIQVPEGVWDLLMGNYDRMHSADPRERAEESMRLATSMTNKHSPIRFVTLDGERVERDNEFGFIEIERVTEKLEPISPDTEFLTALELVEG
jgi:hypothetical protein